MIEINDAEVERLAKKLVETDGFEWQLEFKLPLPPGAKPALRPVWTMQGASGIGH
jgi:hypothetical protein